MFKKAWLKSKGFNYNGTKITKIYTNDDEGVLGMTRLIYDQSNNFSHYQSLYYLFDNLGSVVAITDDSGKLVQYYQYDPYGQITNTTNDPINNITFIGRYYGQKDWDTGFTYFWHRWYDSQNGRWISRDPIGIKGGYNLYEYVKGNPINLFDVDGLNSCETQLKSCLVHILFPIDLSLLGRGFEIIGHSLSSLGEQQSVGALNNFYVRLFDGEFSQELFAVTNTDLAAANFLKLIGKGSIAIGIGIAILDLADCGVSYYSCCQGRNARNAGVH